MPRKTRELDILSGPIPLTAYYPDCVLPNCDSSMGVHQHILPHQQQINDCTTKYLYCQGGVGSAKSLAFAIKTVRLSLEIPQNEGIVGRRDFQLLYRSSWAEIKACIKRLVQRGYLDPDWYESKCFSRRNQGDYSIITFANGSQLFAVQTKNLTESLGTNYGLAWIDDAMETSEEFFVGDTTSAGLLSRIRLPHIHYDKSTYNEATRAHGSLHCMVSSNPPPYDHWLHKLFGDKPGVHKLGEDDVTWMRTATTDNPFVGASYAKGLIAVQQRMGNPESTTRRVIFGESIPAYKGRPVFAAQFERTLHIAPLQFRADLPLIRGWDFGYNHPAVVFSNLFRCKHGANHYFALSEVADAFNVTIYRFYEDYVRPHTEALYSNRSVMRDAGDRSGFRGSSANRDGRSDMKILIEEYKLPFSFRSIALEPSLQYMRSLLKPRRPCPCSLPLILISDKCPVLIAALEGGYHFPASKSGGQDRPIEDRMFADVACAWRYGAENFVRSDVRYGDHVVKPRPMVNAGNIYQWLDDVDRALMAMSDPINDSD